MAQPTRPRGLPAGSVGDDCVDRISDQRHRNALRIGRDLSPTSLPAPSRQVRVPAGSVPGTVGAGAPANTGSSARRNSSAAAAHVHGQLRREAVLPRVDHDLCLEEVRHVRLVARDVRPLQPGKGGVPVDPLREQLVETCEERLTQVLAGGERTVGVEEHGRSVVEQVGQRLEGCLGILGRRQDAERVGVQLRRRLTVVLRHHGEVPELPADAVRRRARSTCTTDGCWPSPRCPC